MAERKTFSRYNMRCGMVLRATEGNRRLEGFNLPELDSRFLVLTAKDIPGENLIRVMGAEIPLLADDYIAYPGQPLLVLFGPDYETTELAIEKINVITSPAPEVTEEDDASVPDPLFFSWGLDDNADTEEDRAKLKKVETSFEIGHTPIKSSVRYTILSWPDGTGNAVHVSCPMQWMELTKETVEAATALPPDSVYPHQERYDARYDEYMIEPVFYAAYTAIAATKTRLYCEMIAESNTIRTGISFHLTTWSDSNDVPKFEEISAVVNQGAFVIAGKEVQRQIMAGLLPKYNLESFKALIRTEKTATAPSSFCGSLLFASAMTAKGVHSSRLAGKANLTPTKYLEKTTAGSSRFTDFAPIHDLKGLVAKILTISEKSDFARKWASSNLHAGEFGLTGYLSGIGLASGLSIAGFSTSAAKDNDFNAQISFTQKRMIAISGTIPPTMARDKVTKETLQRFFKGETPETIIFQESDKDTLDSGPDILSSYQSNFLPQLMTATIRLGQLKDQKEPPITLKFGAQNLTSPCEFEFSGFGAAACELIISKISLQPIVKTVWLNIAVSTIYSRTAMQKAKAVVLQVLNSLGCELAPDFSMDVEITSEGRDIMTFSSIEGTVTGLTMSAYANALWQALGEKSSVSLPTSARNIEKILNGGKSED